MLSDLHLFGAKVIYTLLKFRSCNLSNRLIRIETSSFMWKKFHNSCSCLKNNVFYTFFLYISFQSAK